MFWIFGGGLETGHIFNPSLSPQFLVGEDIVLVYVSHRLSIFGKFIVYVCFCLY